MKPLWIKLFAGIVVLVALYFYFGYPPGVQRRNMESRLQDIANLVATADYLQIRDNVMSYFADNAHIKLDVSYAQPEEEDKVEYLTKKTAVVHEFGKPLFTSYLGNILYSLKKYNFGVGVSDFKMSDDWQSADVVLASVGSAEGESRFVAKQMRVRFLYEAVCEVKLNFSGSAKIEKLDCKIHLPVPVPVEQQ
jgi:hypothetical protein